MEYSQEQLPPSDYAPMDFSRAYWTEAEFEAWRRGALARLARIKAGLAVMIARRRGDREIEPVGGS